VIIKAIFVLIAFIGSMAAGCKQQSENQQAVIRTGTIEKDGAQISLSQTLECNYPGNSPVFEKKKNRKLVLIDAVVTATAAINQTAPTGAILMDSRGNRYETSPGVVAMAQANKCIKGDDIKGYNAIWNETLKKNEVQQAFVLGYELPEDAIADKLFWNKKWEDENIFFILSNTFTVKNKK
jgi:hypothetical protein